MISLIYNILEFLCSNSLTDEKKRKYSIYSAVAIYMLAILKFSSSGSNDLLNKYLIYFVIVDISCFMISIQLWGYLHHNTEGLSAIDNNPIPTNASDASNGDESANPRNITCEGDKCYFDLEKAKQIAVDVTAELATAAVNSPDQINEITSADQTITSA